MTLTKVQGRWVKYKFRCRDQNTAYSTCAITNKVMKRSSQVTGKMNFKIQGTLMTLTLNDLDILTNRSVAISQILSTEELEVLPHLGSGTTSLPQLNSLERL